MGFLSNLQTNFRLVGASFKLTFTNPIVFLMPLFNLIWMGIWVWGPVSFFIWHAENHPEAAAEFWKNLYFITVNAAENGNWELAISSAIIESYVLYAVWLTFVLWGTLYFVTAGMDYAKQVIQKNGNASFGASFGVANRNLGRLFLMALFNATLIAWIRYLLRFTIGVVPIVGRWVNRAVGLVLTGVTYLMLPIIVYERAGTIEAFKSAWACVKETWSGVLLGGTIVYGALWVAFNFVMQPILEATVGFETWASIIVGIVFAAILYSIAVANGATMRAVLYLYATTGEVPAGFRKDDLPESTHRGPITALVN